MEVLQEPLKLTLPFSSCLAACLQRGCQMDVPEDTEKNSEKNQVWTERGSGQSPIPQRRRTRPRAEAGEEGPYPAGTSPLLPQTSARSGHSGHTWGGSASLQPGGGDRVTESSTAPGGQSGHSLGEDQKTSCPNEASTHVLVRTQRLVPFTFIRPTIHPFIKPNNQPTIHPSI